MDLQGLLAASEGVEVRRHPVQVDQPQQALDEPGCLPECHTEQHLRRQAGLDGFVTVVELSATFAGRRCLSDHGGIKPDHQRTAARQRFVL